MANLTVKYNTYEKQKGLFSYAIIKLQNIKTQERFLDCIMNSKSNVKKNASGCPVICEEAAILYAVIACGGQDEALKMIAGFKKYWK